MRAGCFIIDPPFGNGSDSHESLVNANWGLDGVLKAIHIVFTSFPPPFSIILYSLWDLMTMQQALLDHAGLSDSLLETSEFIMVKVTTCSQHTCYLSLFPCSLQQLFTSLHVWARH